MEVRFAYGYYESVHNLIREINKSLSKLLPMAGTYVGVVSVAPREDNQMLKLKYNESSKRLHFLMSKNQSLTFQPALATILRVGGNKNLSKVKDEDTFSWISANVSDITLYCYTAICWSAYWSAIQKCRFYESSKQRVIMAKCFTVRTTSRVTYRCRKKTLTLSK